MADRELKPPAGLGAPGRRLWRAVAGPFELRPDEELVLLHAAKTVDLLTRIDKELEAAPLTVRGSMGQLTEHPLISEGRAQRSLLARLLGQLRLPESEAQAVVTAAEKTSRARKAASQRWHRAS